MPPNPGMFTPELSEYRPPMYGGVAPRPYPAFNFGPVFGDGAAGSAAGMLLQPLISQLMGGQGMVMGQFQPSRNIIDTMQAQQFFAQQQQAMQASAMADRLQQQRMLAGTFQMMNIPIGPQQQRFIGQAVDQFQAVAPIFASVAPDMYDSWHGLRGSAQIMGQQFNLGGRHLLDPVSGQFGMRGASAGVLANDVFNELYGSGRDVTRMNGLGAGRAGQMFEELARRGYLGSLTRGETLSGLQSELGFASQGDMLKHFGGADSPGLQTAARGFDARRVASRLQEMSGAVAAMRDIFGDMGEPNAPMAKLISGLNQLTQGGMSSMNGTQLEMTARRLGNMARSSGMGMDVLTQVMAAGSGVADRLGLDRQFVPQAALSAGAFGQAYRTVGGGGIPGFGRMDAEGMTMLDQTLRLSGASSGLANMLGVGARMISSGMVAPGSDLHRMMDAVKSGQQTFTTATGRVVDLAGMANNPDQFIQLAQGAGVNGGIIGQMLQSRRANQEFILKEEFGISNFARRMQGAAEIDPMLQTAASQALGPVLLGMASPAALAGVSRSLAGSLRGMSPGDRGSARRTAILAGVIRAQIGEATYAKLGSTDAERNRKLAQMAESFYSNADDIAASVMPGYSGIGNVLDAHSSRTLDAADMATADNIFTSLKQSAFASVGQAGPMRRFAESIAGATSDTGLMEIIAGAFGGVKQSEINRAISPLARSLQEAWGKMNAMEAGTGSYAGMSLKARQEMMADQSRRIREILGGRDSAALTEMAKSLGITGIDADKELIRRVMTGEITDPAVVEKVRTSAGLLGMSDAMGLSLSADDRRAFRALQAGSMSGADAAGVVAAGLGARGDPASANFKKLGELLGSSSRRTAVVGGMDARNELIRLARVAGMLKEGEDPTPEKMKDIVAHFRGKRSDLISQLEGSGIQGILMMGGSPTLEDLNRAIESAPPPKVVSGGSGAGGGGSLTIDGTLIVKAEGPADLTGTGKRGGAMPPERG